MRGGVRGAVSEAVSDAVSEAAPGIVAQTSDALPSSVGNARDLQTPSFSTPSPPWDLHPRCALKGLKLGDDLWGESALKRVSVVPLRAAEV